MKPFCELQSRDLNASILLAEIGARGYVLLREVLPRDEINKALGSVAQVIDAAGWLLPGYEPSQRMANVQAACGDPDPGFKRTYQEVFNLAAFHALPHHPALKRVMKMLVGNRLLVHPKPIGRLIFPNCERLTVHAHQDYRFMGGDPECFLRGFRSTIVPMR